MKNKLWTFGDSFTAGILPDIDHFPPYVEYLKYLGISKEEFPEGWVSLLAKKLNLEYENTAVGGSSNQETFFKICLNVDKFKKNDIVIINWTYFHRFLWGLEKEEYSNGTGIPFGKFKRASHNVCDDDLLKITPIKVFESVGINKSLPCWVEEIKSYELIINTLSNLTGFNVFYWSAESQVYLENSDVFGDSKYICNNEIQTFLKEKNKDDSISEELFFLVMEKYGMTSIFQETNGLIPDRFHRGIEGNKKQAEIFYKWVVNNLYNK